MAKAAWLDKLIPVRGEATVSAQIKGAVGAKGQTMKRRFKRRAAGPRPLGSVFWSWGTPGTVTENLPNDVQGYYKSFDVGSNGEPFIYPVAVIRPPAGTTVAGALEGDAVLQDYPSKRPLRTTGFIRLLAGASTYNYEVRLGIGLLPSIRLDSFAVPDEDVGPDTFAAAEREMYANGNLLIPARARLFKWRRNFMLTGRVGNGGPNSVYCPVNIIHKPWDVFGDQSNALTLALGSQSPNAPDIIEDGLQYMVYLKTTYAAAAF